MRALLDGDIYAYRPAAASENDDLGIAIARMEEMIDNTLAETGADEFSIFLSGPSEKNFRYQVYPEYKANRPPERPRHLADLKQYLVEKYGAVVSDGCEADDLLGIEQCAAASTDEDHWTGTQRHATIICSLDKDLRMIPGHHYSFEISGKITKGPNAGKTWTKPMEKVFVHEHEALYHFYRQMLIGDPADNIKGAVGVGTAKAAKILADCVTEQDFYEAIEPHFSCEEEILMTGQCLWIFRKPNDRWQIPKFTV